MSDASASNAFQPQKPAWLGGSPKNVGIVAMDMYFPKTFVSQSDLEKYDGVSEGKYTIGLGQSSMAVCGNAEDVNSVCMTAVRNLLDKYNIPFSAIGRLEIGTETFVDKSKAVKTSLMQMFAEHGNTDIEGVDSKNACYGGTAAVLNSLSWVESSAWDGRYAIAVAGDIAVYEKGPARPTGGAGVVAMLIGPNAPLVVEPVRATHMEHVWDFYKPTMDSEYPRVDGHLSNECYLRALDTCYLSFADKWSQWQQQAWSLDNAQFSIFHAPYNKLVQKSFGRLVYHEYRQHGSDQYKALEPYASADLSSTYTDREFVKLLSGVAKPTYERMVRPTELVTKECGNSYCGSLYAGLMSLVANKADDLAGSRVLMFSYGSGLAATLFSLKVTKDVQHIRDAADVIQRLESREKLSPETFEAVLDGRKETYTKSNFSPDVNPAKAFFPGTYYLDRVDELERRHYKRYRGLHTSARDPSSTFPSTASPTKQTAHFAAPAALSLQARATFNATAQGVRILSLFRRALRK